MSGFKTSGFSPTIFNSENRTIKKTSGFSPRNSAIFVIFVPKKKDKQESLYPLDKGDHVAIYNDFTVNKDKNNYEGQNILVFLKQIYDKKSEKEYDRVFATNVEEVVLGSFIKKYKKRWRIETGFRVQDESKIKCKSKEMKIRYFLFMFEQMLQTQWVCFYKEEVSFKRFVIEMHKLAMELVKKPKANYGRP